MNFNKAIILGRVSQAPELRSTPGGQSVASMGVATNRVWNDKSGQKQEEVEFHSVVLWGKQAEIASQFLTKGSLVLIEGRLRTRAWTDKDGVARRRTEIIAEGVQLPPKSTYPKGGKDIAAEEKLPADAEDPGKPFPDAADAKAAAEEVPF